MIEMKGLVGKITGVDIGDIVKIIFENNQFSPAVGYIWVIEPEHITIGQGSPYQNDPSGRGSELKVRYHLGGIDNLNILEKRITPERKPTEI